MLPDPPCREHNEGLDALLGCVRGGAYGQTSSIHEVFSDNGQPHGRSDPGERLNALIDRKGY